MPLPESQGNKWRELLHVGLEEQMGPGLAFAWLQVPGDTWEEAVRRGAGEESRTGYLRASGHRKRLKPRGDGRAFGSRGTNGDLPRSQDASTSGSNP